MYNVFAVEVEGFEPMAYYLYAELEDAKRAAEATVRANNEDVCGLPQYFRLDTASPFQWAQIGGLERWTLTLRHVNGVEFLETVYSVRAAPVLEADDEEVKTTT